MAKSKIEWTGETWNCIRGCKPVSSGCANCYAMRQAGRFSGPGKPYEGLVQLTKNGHGFRWTGDFREVREMLDVPLRRKVPTTYFVNSMSDVFGEGVSDGFIMDIFRVIANCPQHTFQLLTKRSARMVEWFLKWTDVETDGDAVMARGPKAVRAAHASGRARLFADMIEKWGEPPAGAAYPTYDWMEGMRWWPNVFSNAWLGVSVENASHVSRIDDLRKVPARIRFVSFEPLLGDLGDVNLTGVHLAIFGGESGNGARPCDIGWIRNGIKACRAQGVKVFVKQLGAKPSHDTDGPGGTHAIDLIDPKGGDMDEWPTDLRIREMPQSWFGMVP